MKSGAKVRFFFFMSYFIYKKNILSYKLNILYPYSLQFAIKIMLRIDSILLLMNKYLCHFK